MSDPTPIELPPRKMLADDVYDAIKRSIITNQLASGAKINLDQLSREIGVSNTPIRHALSRLEAEGLVVKTPYRGYAVTDVFDTSRVEYVYETRLILEPQIAALAAARRADPLLDQLSGYIGRAGRDLAEAGQLDATFHLAIADSAGNPMLHDHVERLVYGTTPGGPYNVRGDADLAWQEHAEILDALRRRDADGARDAMARHLENARERFRNRRDQLPG